jgi:hypothetical protein
MLVPARPLVALAPLLLLTFACGGANAPSIPSDDSVPPAGAASTSTPTLAPAPAPPTPPPPAASPTSGCTWSNLLDRDSFYVVADALRSCVATPSVSGCTRVHSATEDSLTIADLDEGVGTIRFMYTATNEGHAVLGSRIVSPTTNETVLTAAGVPAAITLEQALTTFFAAESAGKKAFVCTVAP